MSESIKYKKNGYIAKLDIYSMFVTAYLFTFLGFLFADTYISTLFPGIMLLFIKICKTVVPVIMLVAILLVQKYSKIEEVIFSLVLFLVFGVSVVSTGDGVGIFISILFILASKTIDKMKFYRFSLIVVLLSLFLVSLLSQLGIIENVVEDREMGESVTRNALGFAHPNSVGMLSFLCVAIFEFINKKSVCLKKHVFPCFLILTSYLLTNSVTSLITSILVLIASIYCNYRGKVELNLSKKIKKNIFVLTALILISFALYILKTIWDNPKILPDKLFTFRIRFLLAKDYIKAYGFKLFGSKIISGNQVVLPNTHKIQYAYLDNGFINMLIVGGVLCFSLMIILLILHFITLLKNNNRFELLLMCILCMYFLCESGMNSIINNVFIIELADVIYHTSPSGVNTKFKTLKHVDDVLRKRRKRI